MFILYVWDILTQSLVTCLVRMSTTFWGRKSQAHGARTLPHYRLTHSPSLPRYVPNIGANLGRLRSLGAHQTQALQQFRQFCRAVRRIRLSDQMVSCMRRYSRDMGQILISFAYKLSFCHWCFASFYWKMEGFLAISLVYLSIYKRVKWPWSVHLSFF